MNFGPFDIVTALRLIGFVYVVTPVAVWVVLKGKHPTVHLANWCGGALLFGFGSAMTGLRGTVPPYVETELAQLLVLLSYLPRIGALTLEMGRDPRWRIRLLTAAGVAFTYLAADFYSAFARQAVFFSLMWLMVASLAWTSLQVWFVTRLPSARLIAGAYAVLLLCGTFGLPQALSGPGMRMEGDQFGTLLMITSGMLAALLGSIGYVGIAMERVNRKELGRARELEREAAQRVSIQHHAQQLQAWLDEREELIRLLAHEVRQPLNNAMAALHATHRALGAKDLDFDAVSHRVRRAEGVLVQITNALDNTLAATALLASPDRVEPRDVDVDTVTALSIGDLSPELRKRVQVHRVSQVRTATMDAGLMRLALRNLLSNAGAYTPPQTPIVLRVTDSEDPLGLIFAVIDQGPGIAPELAATLFQRGVRGRHDGAGHGLGLYVVRRVMELHGGSVDVGRNPGGGAIFRLTLPQTDDAYSAPMPLDALPPQGAATSSPRKT